MTSARLAVLGFLIALTCTWTALALGASVDTIALVIALAALVPATAFVFIYGTTSNWHTYWIGRALMVSSTGMAGLMYLAVFIRLFGQDYPGRAYLTTGVFLLVGFGALLKLVSVLTEKIPLWAGERERRVIERSHR